MNCDGSGKHMIQCTDDIIELYTWNQYNFINQRHCNKSNKNKVKLS